MSELLFGVEPFYVLTWLMAATAAGAGLGWKILKMLNQLESRGKLHSKAHIIAAKHSDDETDRLHEDRSENHILPTMETLLKEDLD